jgi:hypothetical protein
MDDKMVIIRENGRVVFASIPMPQHSAETLIQALGEGEVVDAKEGRKLKQTMFQ